METKLVPRGPDTEIDKLKKEGNKKFEEIQKLTVLVNTGNTISRNRLCLCKSGKKWKHCCIKKHEAQTLILEKMCKEYSNIAREVRKLMREKLV